MFEKEDFELPLEKQLRLRVITKEIEECSDIEALKENLITCAASLMKFQHLATRLAERQMVNFMGEFLDKLGVEVPEESDGGTR